MVYCAGYITRINYAAAVSEIVISEGFSKSAAGMVTTAAFASYGIGQLISGVLGDRFNPRRLIFIGLFSTSLLNLIMPFCHSIAAMGILWFFNGLAQASLWPPLVRIMSVCLDEVQFQKSCVGVSIASSVGTVAVYFIVPACIGVGGWRTVFYVCAAIGIISSLVWILFTKNAQRCLELYVPDSFFTPKVKSEGFVKILLKYGLVGIAASILIHGILKDGITTWLPSYLVETFNTNSKTAILCAVILPVMGIAGMQAASWVYNKTRKNEMLLSSLFFILAFVFALIMTLLHSLNITLSISLAALINGLMYAINIMLICMVPAKFKKYGKVSTVSGLLNFFTYAGSAVSTYAIAKISELFGWQLTIASWGALCIIGALLCFADRHKEF